jgi:acetyl esterase
MSPEPIPGNENLRFLEERRRLAAQAPGGPLTIEGLRAGYERTFRPLNAAVPSLARREEQTLPGPKGEIPILVQAPSREEQLPIIVFVHGGGFGLGGPWSEESMSARLALNVHALVVSVDYRLAPEYPYPAGNDDVYAALCWVAERGRTLGGDPGRLAIAGDSAGATLSLDTALRVSRAQGPQLRAMGLLFGWFVGNLDTASGRSLAPNDPVIPEAALRFLLRCYLGENGTPFDYPTADLSGAPPACLIVGTEDPLRSDSELLAAALDRAGVAQELHLYGQLPHQFVSYTQLTDARRAERVLAEFLAIRLHSGSG